MSEIEELREALARIAETAGAASKRRGASSRNSDDAPGEDVPGCSIKALPKRLLIKAAKLAAQVNPANAPQMAPIAGDVSFAVMEPMQIAVLTQKYWGPATRQLTVSFMETTPSELQNKILEHMNAWSRTCGISFVLTNRTGDVRITRTGSGFWSYLGTDIRFIPRDRPTMCLQDFSLSTPDSEYQRVVRHEAGHTLGFPHEHMRNELIARIDPQKAYAYFWATQRWNQQMVDAQVLTPLDQNSIFATTPDQTSIMCYQLPGSITKDGKPILGGVDINDTDYRFAGTIYPKTGSVPASVLVGGEDGGDDWDESEDVRLGE